MTITKRLVGGVAVVAAVLVLNLGTADSAPATSRLQDVKILESSPTMEGVQGLAFAQGQLWSIESPTGDIIRYNVTDRKVVGRLSTKIGEPRALAWDGQTFWCAGKDVYQVHQIDPTNGKIIKTIEIPRDKSTSPVTLESLAWDGKSLWIGYASGWSSRVVRLDVKTGRVVNSIFSNGIPRGLTSDGKSLWMATYNQGRSPSLLTRWTIMEDPTKMGLTQVFVARLPGKNPVGLVWDGRAFWYADREQKAFRRVQLPAGQ